MKDIGLLILRIGLSLPMMTHGFGKLARLMEGDWSFGNPIGIGEAPSLVLTIFAEFICPIFVIIGFKTRWFAIPIVFTMMVAALIAHSGDPFHNRELATLYATGFAAIALMGAGKFSIDRK